MDMIRPATHYIIVENSGMENERDVFEASSLAKAIVWIERQYQPDEIDTLNVRICKECDGQRTYEY